MSKWLTLLCLCLFGALPGFACVMDTDQRASTVSDYVSEALDCLSEPPSPYWFDEAVERAFLMKINTERVSRGLPALRPRLQMRPAARFHSLDMAANAYFAHQSPIGRSHSDRLSAFDRTLLSSGSAENVAQSGPIICQTHSGKQIACSGMSNWSPPDPAEVAEELHQRLMNSPGHRRNILHPDMTHAAIGVARTETGFWVTQLFASHAGDLSAPVPLEIEAGQGFDLDAYLPDWPIMRFAISNGPRPLDLKTNLLPVDLFGEYMLNVRGERIEIPEDAGPGEQLRVWIYVAGPSFIALPARGS